MFAFGDLFALLLFAFDFVIAVARFACGCYLFTCICCCLVVTLLTCLLSV